MSNNELVAAKIRRHGLPGQWNLQVNLSTTLCLQFDGSEVVNMDPDNLGFFVAKQLQSMTTRDLASCIDDAAIVDRPVPQLPDLQQVKVDPQTYGFVSIGAANHLAERKKAGGEAPGGDGGQVELIDQVLGSPAVHYAEWLYERHSDEFPAVFAYEVAEPLGAALAEAIAEGQTLTPEQACRLAEEIFDDAFDVTEPDSPDVRGMDGPARASLFFEELLASIETVSGIAEEHGENALVTLIYLQGAIANGGQIEALADDPIHSIVGKLASAHEWVEHILVV